MKKTLSLIIIIIITCSIKAQDIILTKDKQKIEAKIEEVGIESVKYKKYNNPSGATHLILKSDIATIMYENGDFDVFVEKDKKKSKIEKDKKNTTNTEETYPLANTTFVATVSGNYQVYNFSKKDVEYTVREKSLLGRIIERKECTYDLKYPKLDIMQDNIIIRTLVFIDKNTIRYEPRSGNIIEFVKQ